jgi:ketosteroid isomerase-like protein
MKNLLKVCFLVFSFLAAVISCSSPSNDLTEEIVRDVVIEMENAVNNGDIDGFSAALSDDVTIVMNIRMQGKTQVLRPSKQEYISMLEQSWSVSENYRYSRSNLKIDIQGNKAVVTADISESMTVQGRNIAAETHEEVTIEMVNSKPLVTNVVGHTTM